MTVGDMQLMSCSIGVGLLGLFAWFVIGALSTPTKDSTRGELMYEEDEGKEK